MLLRVASPKAGVHNRQLVADFGPPTLSRERTLSSLSYVFSLVPTRRQLPLGMTKACQTSIAHLTVAFPVDCRTSARPRAGHFSASECGKPTVKLLLPTSRFSSKLNLARKLVLLCQPVSNSLHDSARIGRWRMNKVFGAKYRSLIGAVR